MTISVYALSGFRDATVGFPGARPGTSLPGVWIAGLQPDAVSSGRIGALVQEDKEELSATPCHHFYCHCNYSCYCSVIVIVTITIITITAFFVLYAGGA